MKVEIDGRVLVRLFNDFVKQQKLMFNFTTDGTKMWIQILDDYTATTIVDVKSLDDDHTEQSISVWIPAFIHAMSNHEPVEITITDAVMYIEQKTFNCTLIREYEEKRTLPVPPTASEITMGVAQRLKYLAHCAISCTTMAKELSIPNPDPMFSRNRYYLNYNQAAFVEQIKFPEVCIPYPTFTKFVFKLDENAGYAYLPENETLYFLSGEYEFWVPVTNYNINVNVINALDSLRTGCENITVVNFNRYKTQLESIVVSLPKTKVMLAFGDETFRIVANGNRINAYIGDDIADVKTALYITTGQLSVILKLFSEDEKVEVRKGVKNICLVSGEKTLMIAETSS